MKSPKTGFPRIRIHFPVEVIKISDSFHKS